MSKTSGPNGFYPGANQSLNNSVSELKNHFLLEKLRKNRISLAMKNKKHEVEPVDNDYGLTSPLIIKPDIN